MKKVPYGSVVTFNDLVNQGYFYVDRTHYLEKIETLSEKHLFFLRPRRFGKSLFISVLHHYYGLEHQDTFDQSFGGFYAGQHPTSLRNSYLILSFNFSGIDTTTQDSTYQGFLTSVRLAVEDFLATYSTLFTSEYLSILSSMSSPEEIMKQLWNWVRQEGKGKKVYVLIDEYDQFTNELVAYRFEEFKEIVGRNGWVRKFYETLKIGADRGIIDRTFITGVTPITFDSLTSGFSNAYDISTELEFCGMMGFTDIEVRGLIENMGIEGEVLEETMTDLKSWYNGYNFNKNSNEAVYNSEMVLFFIKEYLKVNHYPENLLATSVATDYHKIQSMFRIAHQERENLQTLRKILANDQIASILVQKFNFEENWEEHHFISLLYYLGFLTIKESDIDSLIFTIPNYVIRQLYFQFFMRLTLDDAKLNTSQVDVRAKVLELAKYNNINPIIELTESVLSQLSVHHDKAAFNETHPKAIFASWFYITRFYNIYSELEVEKKNKDNEKGRIDLLLTRRAPFEADVPYQFIFELKYLKKATDNHLKKVKKEAVEQLQEYLKDDKVKDLKDLRAYVVVFVGNKAEVVEL